MDSGKSWQKLLSAAVTCAVVLGQVLPIAQAASTDLADIPMAIKNTVKPNIMFTLDNSGSMEWPFIWDTAFFDASYSSSPYGNSNCFRNSLFNAMYYDPSKTYMPGVDANGNSLGNSSFTTAKPNGYIPTYVYSTAQWGTWFGGGTYTSAPVNLATSFQAFSDMGSSPFTAWDLCVWNSTGCETPQPAYYHKYTGAGTPAPNTCYADSAYTKVVVSATSGPGGTDERTNFANWYTYYRTRITTMKSAMGRAFSGIDSKYRVGFYTIDDNSANTNTSGANLINISDFNAAQKSTWYSMLYSIAPAGATPLGESMRQVGELFRTGALPGATGSTDPIQYSCQPNYQIVATDGMWNVYPSVSVGDQDRTVPALPAPVSNDPIAGQALTPGSNWPTPFYEGSTATSDTLADIAMYYWASDLRPSLVNNVPANASDPATWQHLVNFTIGLGVDGVLPFNSTTYNNLKNGTVSWPVPSPNANAAIDDLWHAAVNSHGQYFSAKDPVAIQNSLTTALNSIIGRSGAAAAVAVSNANVIAGDNFSYASSYNSGSWSGDLQSYPIDLTTGRPNTAAPSWANSAQTQLDALLWTNRAIATYSGSVGVPFQWGNLTVAQQARLNSPVAPPGPADGANVLSYLRGNRSGEGTNYRTRAHVLGDIINAEPVIVRAPTASYVDNGYAAFKSSNASRTKMVYQGANDGMLHAFDAATGAERWAYIPGLLFSKGLPSFPATSALVNLSMTTGFTHLYYVDGTPAASDVDFSFTNNFNLNNPPAPDWHTILVGGLRKGGRGYYALDVTNPSAASDSDVATKVLWEFPNNSTSTTVANNIGYSFGKPVIVKTQATGWVVLVTSGYNNGTDSGGDGQGHLFVLNAKTGDLIKDIPTGVGSAISPSGLAQISGFVQNGNLDNTVQYVYGGDLLGNVWRFDFTSPSTVGWRVAQLATLVDGSNNAQPVTTAPELGDINGKRLVYVGTGQYLGDTDIPGATGANASATQTQSIYGLLDNLSTTPLISPLRSNLVQQVLTTSGTTRTATSNAVDLSTKKGWYVDFPVTGERLITDPVLALGALILTSNIPSSDVCTPGGSSWLYVLDYRTGGYIPGFLASWSAISLGNTLASRPTLIMLPSGSIDALTRQSDASTSTTQIPLPPSSPTGRRVTWREILFR